MRKLLIYLKDYKKETVCAPLFKMLEATFELFTVTSLALSLGPVLNAWYLMDE